MNPRDDVHEFRTSVDRQINSTLVVGSASAGQNLQFGSGGFSWVTPASVSFDDLAPSGSGSPGMLTTDGATWSYVSYATARTSLGLVIGTDVQAYSAMLAARAALTWASDKGVYLTGTSTLATFDLPSFGRSLCAATTKAAAKTVMGLEIGTDVQQWDAKLDAIAGLTWASDKGALFTGAGTLTTFDLTAAGRALIDDADATAQRATLGLVIGTDVVAPQNERASEAFWDCDGGLGDWLNYLSGAGAAAYTGATDHVGGSLHVDGEWGMGTGTTSTGIAAFYRQPFTGFGGGTAYEFEARITNGALSTAGEEFQLTVGFGDAFNAAGQPVDCACFIYRRSTDGDFWVAATRSNSTETKTVTAVAPGGYAAMTIFRVEVNAAGTSISYSINGSVVATHTTNIPTGSSRLLGCGLKIEKQAGTSARYANVDWFRLKKTRTAAR